MKKATFFFLVIFCIVFFSCKFSQKEQEKKSIETVKQTEDKDDYYLGIIDEAFYINKIDTLDFKTAKINIIKVPKPRPVDASSKNKEKCNNWKVSSAEVLLFLEKARFSCKNEMMKKFYWEPCEVEIHLSINSIYYVLIFNKGYNGKLIYENEIYYIVDDSVLD